MISFPTTMWITLVMGATAMLCVMGVCADVQPQRDFDAQKFAGKWYRVGLAYDSPGFLPYKDKLRISVGILTPLANGDVTLNMWSIRSSGCRSKVYTYEKSSTPGLFSYFSTRHNKVKDITVVETNYTEYALVVKHKKMDREYTQVALYGRSQRLKPEVIQKYKDLATSLGFPRESILTPPPAENCPPSAG